MTCFIKKATKMCLFLTTLLLAYFVQAEKFSMFDMSIEQSKEMRLNMECVNYVVDSPDKTKTLKKYASLLLALAMGQVEGYKETFENNLHHEYLFNIENFQNGYSLGKIDLYMKLNEVNEREAKSKLFILEQCENQIAEYLKIVTGRTENEIISNYTQKH